MKLIIASTILFLFASIHADVVFLSDGTKREGKVVAEDETAVRLAILSGPMSVEVTIPKSHIDTIVRKETPNERLMETYRQRLAAIDEQAADEWYALGLWCEQHKALAAQGKRAFEVAIEIDPDHALAQRRLGHIQHEGTWLTPEQFARAKGMGSASNSSAPGSTVSEEDRSLVSRYIEETVQSLKERVARAEAELAEERQRRLESEKRVRELEGQIGRLERQLSRAGHEVRDRRPIIILRDKDRPNENTGIIVKPQMSEGEEAPPGETTPEE